MTYEDLCDHMRAELARRQPYAGSTRLGRRSTEAERAEWFDGLREEVRMRLVDRLDIPAHDHFGGRC